MGTRYFIDVKCPDCSVLAEGVYYAPTCDCDRYECVCGNVIDLEKYTGITYADASNLAEIEGLVDSIRNQYTSDYVSSPGETLLEILEAIGMTQAELAECTGESIEMINGIIEGIVPITPEMVLRLEHVLDVPVSFWINRERNFRQYLEERKEA